MTAKFTGAIAFWVIAVVLAVTIAAVPVNAGQNDKDDLYATAISGGKTKPVLIDVQNRIAPPARECPGHPRA